MEDIKVNLQTAADLGLIEEEFNRIIEILGRKPNFTELCIFSAMWSEHCSYKNSITWLKKLPKQSDRMLAEAGEENAGLVDIGDGLACSFKIESHNHPSAIEPYQGAATGVGGINRDIFTMGARPVCQLNSLRFGNLKSDRTKWLISGVVKGIGDYGNAFGVPTVGGEVFFDETYNINPLVNAFSAGIVKHDAVVSAVSKGEGNPVFIVGSRTGKDGIHGASFASKDITEDSADDLPAVQVGDPFQEKLLLEATLEVIKTGHIVGMQDMGAAGITCSTSEMSDKGEHGMDIWLDKVPTRQDNMKPFEILLSESQERMLVVVEKGHEQEVVDIFEKWDLHAVQIGVVTKGKMLRYFMGDEMVAEVPAYDLVLGGGAPVYEREYKEPAYFKEFKKFRIEDIPKPDFHQVAEFLLSHPNIASKRWIFEQYDSMVGTDNIGTFDKSDAGVVRIKDTDKALAVSVDCNSRFVNADPEEGCAMAVAEAARNVVCSGGEPLAITNCLNFGNPYNPEVYWQFVHAIKGMKKACEKFGTPVTGGNVSFYNQSSDEGPVFPTPTIGMLGLLENRDNRISISFKEEGDHLYLLGNPKNDISSSEYLYSYCGIKKSPAPDFSLDDEAQLQKAVMKMAKDRLLNSAHDVADGGLYITLVESGMAGNLGFEIETEQEFRKDAYLFGESPSRIVVSIHPGKVAKMKEICAKNKVRLYKLGEVIDKQCIIDGESYLSINEVKAIYDNAIEEIIAH
ncbi:phosphoribosylformylglycinamidine synthase subunit PurL [Hyphobacterium sp. CCMP332]|nr:phosphoribosylformylglycinamidine synthase subunit PurL [Hyphobacterium sp. CCMP332]